MRFEKVDLPHYEEADTRFHPPKGGVIPLTPRPILYHHFFEDNTVFYSVYYSNWSTKLNINLFKELHMHF